MNRCPKCGTEVQALGEYDPGRYEVACGISPVRVKNIVCPGCKTFLHLKIKSGSAPKELDFLSYEKLDQLRKEYPELDRQIRGGLDVVDCLALQIKETGRWEEFVVWLVTDALVGLFGVVCTPEIVGSVRELRDHLTAILKAPAPAFTGLNEMPPLDRVVIIHSPRDGFSYMWVCAVKDAPDEEILAIANAESLGWVMVDRDNVIECEEYPDRLHLMVEGRHDDQ